MDNFELYNKNLFEEKKIEKSLMVFLLKGEAKRKSDPRHQQDDVIMVTSFFF